MAEFKFSCPRCKQHIQCDSSYVGSQINCPLCRQAIIVPPAPPSAAPAGEPVFHIKKSTLKTTALITASILLVAALAMTAIHFFAGPKIVKFRAYVDGTDVVKLQGKSLWIEHLEWQLPNKVTIDGKKWNPAWDGNTSAPYALSRAFNQRNPKNIKLSTRLGRGTVSIMEMPTPENQETLAIKVDDGPYGGADWYEFTISW